MGALRRLLLLDRTGAAAIAWTFMFALAAVITIATLSGIDLTQPIGHQSAQKLAQ